MKILEVTQNTGTFWFTIVFLCVLSLVLLSTSILIMHAAPKTESGVDVDDMVAITVLIFFGVMSGMGAHRVYEGGVPQSYKATITDFNEVFENGYEIVDQEGEIYTIRKQ